MDSLSLEQVEILVKILPNEDEEKKFQKFLKDKTKCIDMLSANDRFLVEVIVFKKTQA